MNTVFKTSIWNQFGAAIEMFEYAVRVCPDQLWRAGLWENEPEQPEFGQFWYIAYHTLFWLDLYVSGSVDGFSPPAPFTLDELDPAGVLPERVYSKEELLTYLGHCRMKCRAALQALTDEKASQRCRFSWGEVSYVELLLDTMRHVQEHAAQLNLFLGQRTQTASGWVAKPKDEADR